jgi:hypothetical protein
MNNLAGTYDRLGRHRDAVALLEKTLEFWRRVLPENHPSIGMTCFNLSTSYRHVGDLHRAVEMAQEAQRIWLATLPLSHPNVQKAQERVCQIESELSGRV